MYVPGCAVVMGLGVCACWPDRGVDGLTCTVSYTCTCVTYLFGIVRASMCMCI